MSKSHIKEFKTIRKSLLLEYLFVFGKKKTQIKLLFYDICNFVLRVFGFVLLRGDGYNNDPGTLITVCLHLGAHNAPFYFYFFLSLFFPKKKNYLLSLGLPTLSVSSDCHNNIRVIGNVVVFKWHVWLWFEVGRSSP